MFTVYILYSYSCKKRYIGFTGNLENRMKSHNELGMKGFTKSCRPWRLIYQEQFEDKSAAMKREKFLKSGQGRAWLNSFLSDQ